MRYSVTLDCRLDAVHTSSLSNYRLYSELTHTQSLPPLLTWTATGHRVTSTRLSQIKQVLPRRCCSRGQHSLPVVEDKEFPKDRVPTHRRPQHRAVSVQQHICRGRVSSSSMVSVASCCDPTALPAPSLLCSPLAAASFPRKIGLRGKATDSTSANTLAGSASGGETQLAVRPRCSLAIPKSSNEDQSLYPKRQIQISCAFI